jgi:glycosyltransferase involved in cell wall biosynthesis
MRPLRVAVLDEELPFPLTSGKRIRTFNLLRRLADRHRITVLCHRNPDPVENAAAEEAFRQLGVETVVVGRSVPPKAGPGFYARLAGNLLSPLPYSVATHASPSLTAAVRRFAAKNPVDVWHCEWTPYAQVMQDALGPKLAATPWAVMAHNVESLIWRRYTEAEPSRMKRWYVRRQWQKFERFERWAYSAATAAIAVSDADAGLIRERFATPEVEVVDNGVDTAYFRPQRDIDRDPARVLFLGSLDWRPNLDAVVLLLDDIFPKVRRQVPHATLALVGRHPPEWLRARVADTPGVELYADVPDVRPFLAACGMLAVPLRIGGGSRLKILEALATETPVVSTRVGAEGLNLTPGRDLVQTDGPEGMADAIVSGIRHPYELEETAESGRRVVLGQYDWGPLAERLDEVWWAVATAATAAAA